MALWLNKPENDDILYVFQLLIAQEVPQYWDLFLHTVLQIYFPQYVIDILPV